MCECGCIATGQFFKLKGPDKKIYVIQRYPGCKSCSTPCGVIFSEISKDHSDFSYYNDLSPICAQKENDVISFFSQEDLKIKLKRYLIEYFNNREFSAGEQCYDECDADIISEEFAEEFFNEK